MVIADDSSPQKTSSSTTSSILSTLYTTLHSIALTIFSTIHSLLNAIIPPSRRASIKANFTTLSQTRPFLASFILAQLLFSGIPLVLFALQAVSVLVFSFTTALVLASLCALTFTAICVGLAVVVLVPVLLVTGFLGLTVWCWAWVGWFVLKWAGVVQVDYNREGGKGGEVKVRKGDGGVAEVKVEEDGVKHE